MGGRGGSSGNGNNSSASAGGQMVSARYIERGGNAWLNPRDGRVQIARAIAPNIGRTMTNNTNAIGAEIGLVDVRHLGNFRFEGKVAGHTVSVLTEPVESSLSTRSGDYKKVLVKDISIKI